jgi:hypothetical protein
MAPKNNAMGNPRPMMNAMLVVFKLNPAKIPNANPNSANLIDHLSKIDFLSELIDKLFSSIVGSLSIFFFRNKANKISMPPTPPIAAPFIISIFIRVPHLYLKFMNEVRLCCICVSIYIYIQLWHTKSILIVLQLSH